MSLPIEKFRSRLQDCLQREAELLVQAESVLRKLAESPLTQEQSQQLRSEMNSFETAFSELHEMQRSVQAALGAGTSGTRDLASFLMQSSDPELKRLFRSVSAGRMRVRMLNAVMAKHLKSRAESMSSLMVMLGLLESSQCYGPSGELSHLNYSPLFELRT